MKVACDEHMIIAQSNENMPIHNLGEMKLFTWWGLTLLK